MDLREKLKQTNITQMKALQSTTTLLIYKASSLVEAVDELFMMA